MFCNIIIRTPPLTPIGDTIFCKLIIMSMSEVGYSNIAWYNDFDPQTTFTPEFVASLLAKPELPKTQASSFEPGNTPEKAIDDLAETRWCASDASTGHWWQVDLGSNHNISSCDIAWESSQVRYQYLVEGSLDGKKWEILSNQRDQKEYKQVHKIKFQKSYLQVMSLPEHKPLRLLSCPQNIF